jgi:hypothetical protein
MKYAITAVLLWMLFGCHKNGSDNNNSNTGLATQPAAEAGFDNQSGGVYKGTLTGSSGQAITKAAFTASDGTIVNLWMNNTTGAFAYLGTNGDFGGGPVSVSGTTVQIPAGSAGSESGTLTVSSDGMTISGSVTGNSCTHAVSLTRIL